MANKNLLLATILDPHYKFSFFDSAYHAKCKDELVKAGEETINANAVADDINEEEDISNVRDENNPFERFLRWNSTEATKESGSRLNEFQSQISAPILDEKIRALSVCLVKFLSSK